MMKSLDIALVASSPQGVPKSLVPAQHILAFQNLQVTVRRTGRTSNYGTPPPHQEPNFKRASRTPLAILQGPSEKVAILQGISGELRGGDLTAILGPSGAGKTTLLDALVGQGGERTRGSVLLDGHEFDGSFRKVAAYVSQDDTLFPYLTVRENLTFAAAVKMPPSVSWEEKERRVTEVIESLGLTAVANGLIGSVSRRGVSGGERRRVSIGAGIVHHPRVLLLDEPLSGLDSVHAFQVVSYIQRMARGGAIVAMTVHQPSMRINSMFDRVLIMCRGQVEFAGAVDEIHPRLAALRVTAGSMEAQFGGNYVEEYLELLLANKGQTAPHAEARFSNPSTHSSAIAKAPVELDAEKGREADESGDGANPIQPLTRGHSDYANGHMREIALLMWRAQLIQMRMPELFLVRILVVGGVGIIVATLFRQLQPTPEGIRGLLSFVATSLAVAYFEANMALPAYIEERVIIGKDTFQNAYRLSTYVTASTLSGIPMSAVLALIYSLLSWWIVGLKGGAPAFSYYWLIIFLCFIVGTSFAALSSALVPNYSIGVSVVICVSYGLFLLSGYFESRLTLPNYWLWLHYASHFKYPYQAILSQQLGLVPCVSLEGGNASTCLTDGAHVLESEGIDVISKWASVSIMLGFAVGYRVLFYIVLRARVAARAF